MSSWRRTSARSCWTKTCRGEQVCRRCSCLTWHQLSCRCCRQGLIRLPLKIANKSDLRMFRQSSNCSDGHVKAITKEQDQELSIMVNLNRSLSSYGAVRGTLHNSAMCKLAWNFYKTISFAVLVVALGSSDDLSSNPTDVYYFCLWPTAEGPSNYLSCSCSRHFINLLLGCTSGLNLAADLGPVLALLLCKNCLTRTKKRPVLANLFMKISHLLTLPLRPRLCDFKKSFRHSFSGESVSSKKFPSRPFRTLTLLGEKSSTVSKMTTQLCLVELGHLLAEGLKIGQV